MQHDQPCQDFEKCQNHTHSERKKKTSSVSGWTSSWRFCLELYSRSFSKFFFFFLNKVKDLDHPKNPYLCSHFSTSYRSSSDYFSRTASIFFTVQRCCSGPDSQTWKWTRLLTIQPSGFRHSLALLVSALRSGPFPPTLPWPTKSLGGLFRVQSHLTQHHH